MKWWTWLIIALVILAAGGGLWFWSKRSKEAAGEAAKNGGGAATPPGSPPQPGLNDLLSNNVPEVQVKQNSNCQNPTVLKVGSTGPRVEELNFFILTRLKAKYPQKLFLFQTPKTKAYFTETSAEGNFLKAWREKMESPRKSDFDSVTLAGFTATTGQQQIKQCDLDLLLQNQ